VSRAGSARLSGRNGIRELVELAFPEVLPDIRSVADSCGE
jgi:hypothetical protein